MGLWAPGCFALIANAFSPVPSPTLISLNVFIKWFSKVDHPTKSSTYCLL